MNLYNSNQSLSSGAEIKEPRVLFLGFSELWERDLWSLWLTEVSISEWDDDDPRQPNEWGIYLNMTCYCPQQNNIVSITHFAKQKR